MVTMGIAQNYIAKGLDTPEKSCPNTHPFKRLLGQRRR